MTPIIIICIHNYIRNAPTIFGYLIYINTHTPYTHTHTSYAYTTHTHAQRRRTNAMRICTCSYIIHTYIHTHQHIHIHLQHAYIHICICIHISKIVLIHSQVGKRGNRRFEVSKHSACIELNWASRSYDIFRMHGWDIAYDYYTYVLLFIYSIM